jgi:HD domain
MSETIAGIKIPDSKMAKDLTELIRDNEPDLLYHHSRRVYLFGALTGQRRGLAYDPELLYVGAMFHDIGLTEQYRNSMLRFEVDGANAARDFLRKYGVPESSVEMVWDAIALHTTPGIPEHTRKRWWRSSLPASRWTSSGLPTRSLTNSRGLPWWLPIPAVITSKRTLSTPSITVWRIGRIAHLAP